MPIDVEALYRQYGPMVLRRCRALLRNEQEALDAMQDTFVQLIRNKERLEDRAPSSLLYRIATNVCLNKIRTRRRHPESPDDELLHRIAALGEPGGRTAARSVLARLFSGEPESSSTIAVLHLVDGLTLEQTAEQVGLSVSGVRKRLRGLKASLRELEGVC